MLSADIYPFYWVDGKKITLPGYMQGLSDLSEVAREHGQELCIVLQCLNNVPGYVRSVETGRAAVPAVLRDGVRRHLVFLLDL